MTYANNLDPDEAPQKVGPHLGFKLFDTDYISVKFVMETMCVLQHLKEIEKETNNLSMQNAKM